MFKGLNTISALLRDVAQLMVAVRYLLFGTSYRSDLQESRNLGISSAEL